MQENKSVFVHFFRRATNSTSVSCIHPGRLVHAAIPVAASPISTWRELPVEAATLVHTSDGKVVASKV
jgi:hypothetical protein